MISSILNRFLNRIVTENISKYELSIDKITHGDKKLYLLYILGPHEYEWYSESETRINAGINEYKNYMQELIDNKIDDLYQMDMLENGYFQHKDNGELVWC